MIEEAESKQLMLLLNCCRSNLDGNQESRREVHRREVWENKLLAGNLRLHLDNSPVKQWDIVAGLLN